MGKIRDERDPWIGHSPNRRLLVSVCEGALTNDGIRADGLEAERLERLIDTWRAVAHRWAKPQEPANV